MCYNIQLLERKADKMAKRYNAIFPQGDLFHPVYHASAFQHPLWPVLTNGQQPTLEFYQWGLIPYWSKNKEDADNISNMTANCMGETAYQKPSFRQAIAKNRCLVPVTGFFEWHTIGKKKYPFYIYRKDNELFSLAGIYDNWVDKNSGEIFNTFSILTTTANPLLAKIHNTKRRMPLILPMESESDWINNSLSKEQVIELIKPFDENLLSAHSISKRITSRTENKNVPEVMDRYPYPELEGEF